VPFAGDSASLECWQRCIVHHCRPSSASLLGGGSHATLRHATLFALGFAILPASLDFVGTPRIQSVRCRTQPD
jgi:hypothetical protein